jgi:hypothetical protein
MTQASINFDKPNHLQRLHERAQTLIRRSNILYKYWVTLPEDEYDKAERREHLMLYAFKKICEIDRILRKVEKKRKERK